MSKSSFWDDLYVSGQAAWDQGAAHPELLRLLKENDGLFKGSQVLVPGAGAGHDAVALTAVARAVTALDFSAQAQERFLKAYPNASLTYLIADFFHASGLDINAIWEHTCLCAIDPSKRTDYFASVARLLPKNGLYAGILFNRARENGEGPPFSTSNDDVLALMKSDFVIETLSPAVQTYSAREGRESLIIARKK